MSKLLRGLSAVLLVPALLLSCDKDPSPPPGGEGSNDPVLTWMHNTLTSDYYWDDAVKAKTPNYNLAYDKFLDNLLIGLDRAGAKDDDGTIDGYYSRGTHYIYSRISREAVTRVEGEGPDFGFGIDAFEVADDRYFVLISWVRPGSDAAVQGLKRGMWITKYNGDNITENDYTDLFYHVYYMEGGTRMNITTIPGLSSATQTDWTINATSISMTPVLYSRVIETDNGTKVGYLVYNEFERGAKEGNGYKFDNQVRRVFSDFGSEGATEFVLDLRYNGGGYVTCCQILSSLISNAATSKIFAQLKPKYNSTSQEKMYYVDESANTIPNLNRLVVLATGNTASASEMVINSLEGIDFEVIHIGEQTNGKNVGMDQYTKTHDGYKYTFLPITFKISNAKNFSDYSGGFVPDYAVNGYRQVTTAAGNGIICDFGDPNEDLLQAALAYIDGGAASVITDDKFATRSAGSGMEKAAAPGHLPHGGAIIVPAETESEE